MKKVRGYKGIYTVDRVKTGRTYYASFRDADHKSKVIRLEAGNPKDAMLELELLKADVRLRKEAITPKPVKAKTNKMTYDKLLDRYKAQRLSEEQDIKQTDANVKRLRIRCKPILKLPISHIQKEHIIRMRNDMERDGKAPSTINQFLAMLSATFSIDGVTVNPTKGVKRLADNREVGSILSQDELRRLFAHIAHKPMLNLFCHLLYTTAARPAAVISLQAKDISEGAVKIKPLKKGAGFSQRVNTDLVFEHIKTFKINKDQYLFHTRKYKDNIDKGKHTAYQTFYTQIKNAFKTLGISGSPYSFRRTAATRLYREKGILIASKYLGHSNLEVTLNYLQIKDDLENLEDVFNLDK